MATKAYKQDLPPKGGYAPITFKRIPAKTVLGGKLVAVLGFTQFFAGALYVKYVQLPRRRAQLVEKEGFQMALMPLLLAERDRGYIKEVKRVRDAEADLMADVKDWEVGTWFGEKVYKTVPDNMLLHYYSVRNISPEFQSHFHPKAWQLDWEEANRAYV